MSFVAHRARLDTRGRVLGSTRSWPSLLITTVLSGLALLVATRWWQQADSVPLSWQRPPAEVLFLLPGAPVVALLALRSVLALRHRDVAVEHLASAASRWAAVWALVTAAWVLCTVVDLYGTGVRGLLGADNLRAVVASSPAAGPRLTVLWVALLVTLFAGRVVGRWESLALLALTSVAMLAAVPGVGAVHGHGTDSHPLIQVAFGAQVLALGVWLGAVAAACHLRSPGYRRRHHLTRLGGLFSTATLVLGVSAVLAGSLRPVTPVAGWIALAQLVAVAVVTTVGHRHRRRTVAVVGSGGPSRLVALVLSELLVLGAVLALSDALPI